MSDIKLFNAVHAAERVYQQEGKFAWLNATGEKNMPWRRRYIHVIAPVNRDADKGRVRQKIR